MHIAIYLVARELAMLVAMGALGSGLASLLSPRFAAVERVALAPVLGFCAGTAVFTTLLHFWPTSKTYWLLPVLAAVSIAVAALRSRSDAATALRRDLAGWTTLVLVAAIVAAPTDLALHDHHTVGPAASGVWDADGYIAETDGEALMSLPGIMRSIADPTGPATTDLEVAYYAGYAQGYQNLDASPLSSNLNQLLGLGATDTWDPFLIAFLIAGALGATATLRYALRRAQLAPAPASARVFGDLGLAPTAGAAIAGMLFSGALFIQLIFAGSQAAISGLTVLLPLAVLAADTVTLPRLPSLLVLSVAVSGLLAFYPLFVPASAFCGGVGLLWMAIRRLRSGTPGAAGALARGAAAAAGVVALAAVMNLVSFNRDLDYFRGIAGGALDPAKQDFPGYKLTADVIPSWLLQTRQLFSTAGLGTAPVLQHFAEIVIPLVLLFFVIQALRRIPLLIWLLPLALASAAEGAYTAFVNHCSYCTDRNLLPEADVLLILLAGGLVASWVSSRGRVRVTVAAAGLAALVTIAVVGRQERIRYTDSGYFLDSATRSVLTHLPADGGALQLEGFDGNPNHAPGELPLVYEVAAERARGRVSVPGDVSYNSALAYFGLRRLDQGQFRPGYAYVLTRLAGVATGRTVIAQSGGIALERRAGALDTTLDGGFGLPSTHLDRAGVAWATPGPLTFLVTGPGAQRAVVGLRFNADVPFTVPPQPGITSTYRHQHLTICARVHPRPVAPDASFVISFTPLAFPVPNYQYPEAPIPVGIQLAAMRAAAGHCPFPVSGR